MAEQYILGRNVTEQASAKEDRGTTVISFRIKTDEFDVLTHLAQKLDRSISQVARSAFRYGMWAPFMSSNTAGNPATWAPTEEQT